jgi:hypothetical protein
LLVEEIIDRLLDVALRPRVTPSMAAETEPDTASASSVPIEAVTRRPSGVRYHSGRRSSPGVDRAHEVDHDLGGGRFGVRAELICVAVDEELGGEDRCTVSDARP